MYASICWTDCVLRHLLNSVPVNQNSETLMSCLVLPLYWKREKPCHLSYYCFCFWNLKFSCCHNGKIELVSCTMKVHVYCLWSMLLNECLAPCSCSRHIDTAIVALPLQIFHLLTPSSEMIMDNLCKWFVHRHKVSEHFLDATCIIVDILETDWNLFAVAFVGRGEKTVWMPGELLGMQTEGKEAVYPNPFQSHTLVFWRSTFRVLLILSTSPSVCGW